MRSACPYASIRRRDTMATARRPRLSWLAGEASATSPPMPPMTPTRSAPSSPMNSESPRKSRLVQPIHQAAYRLEVLQGTPSGRMLLQQAQALPPHRLAPREDAFRLHGFSPSRMRHDLDQVNSDSAWRSALALGRRRTAGRVKLAHRDDEEARTARYPVAGSRSPCPNWTCRRFTDKVGARLTKRPHRKRPCEFPPLEAQICAARPM